MRISVVTVSFNSARTIGETLQSVAAQNWSDFEHVVIDGASTDATAEIVAGFARPGLRFLSEPDSGIYDAMNKGLRTATGDYVIFLNSDDLFARHDVLSLFAKRAVETGADFLFADTRFIAEPGRPASRRLYSANGFRPWWLRIGVMPPHPSMAVRRQTLSELGGFSTGFRIAGDFDLVARAILRDRRSWATLPVVTTLFRTGGVSTSGWRSKLAVGTEMARSLNALGHPLTTIAVQLRYAFKAMQLLPRRS